MKERKYENQKGNTPIEVFPFVYKSRIGRYSRNSVKQDLSASIPL